MSQRLSKFQQWVYSTQTGFLAAFWLLFVRATVCSRAVGGHVANIFHLLVFDPTLGTGKLFKKKLHLIYAELGLFAERKPVMACWCFGAAQQFWQVAGLKSEDLFRSSTTKLLRFHKCFPCIQNDYKCASKDGGLSFQSKVNQILFETHHRADLDI